jgi:hypothetical protein
MYEHPKRRAEKNSAIVCSMYIASRRGKKEREK